MNEVKLPEALTEYFAACGIRICADTWCEITDDESVTDVSEADSSVTDSTEAILSLDGTKNIVREYIDGTSLVEYGFEIRRRGRADSVRDRLDAMSFFDKVNEAVRACEKREFSLKVSSGVAKAAVYDSGEEEYREGYKIVVRQ